MRGAEILRLDVEPYDCQQIRDRLPAICSVVKRERYCSDERLVEMIDYVSNIAKNYGIYIREFMSPELRPQTFAEGILAEQAASLRKSLQSISQPVKEASSQALQPIEEREVKAIKSRVTPHEIRKQLLKRSGVKLGLAAEEMGVGHEF